MHFARRAIVLGLAGALASAGGCARAGRGVEQRQAASGSAEAPTAAASDGARSAGDDAALAAMTPAEQALAAEMAKQDPGTIMKFLLRTFGAPAVASQATTTWTSRGNPAQRVSLSTGQGVTVLVWTVNGRFTFSRTF